MTGPTTSNQRRLLEQALRELRDARQRLAAVERGRHEPVAVLGVGVRTPGGAHDTGELWELLRSGADTVGPLVDTVDGRRDRTAGPPADGGRWASLLPDIDGFDAEFFGISADEADHIDPQQRLILELAWEAIEDAGIPSAQLRERRVGVFLGIYGTDYLGLQFQDPQRVTAFTAPGGAHSIAANRVSYLLDLRGPSLAVDTACSSSLVAVHLAARALRAGDCDLALVGGVNVLLSPMSTLVTEKVLPLSPGGRCRTFDRDADGIVRAEGAGVLLLGREREAAASGRHARAWIRGTAIGHNGRTNGLTAPNPLAQADLLRAALADGDVAAGDVGYVEAHGTGTMLGDPIELEAIRDVYGAVGDRPCAVGSVKTNFGHQEAAAGIVGLIKSILILEHGEVPPHLHLRELNPEIRLDGTRLTIPTEMTPLGTGAAPGCAAVSSFGFGGANAHIVMQETTAVAADVAERTEHPLVLPISARSREALRELTSRYADLLSTADHRTAAELCAAAANHRDHHPFRRAVVGESAAHLADLLRRPLFGAAARHTAPRIAFVFNGQGSQWPGMAAGLMAAEPVARAELERCDEIVRRLAGWSLLAELEASPGHDRMTETVVAQVCIAAVQLALVALWRHWGITPAAVLGHSMGEPVAVCASGALSREAMFDLLLRRAAICERSARGGAMVSVNLPVAEVEGLLRDAGGEVGVAAVNGPRITIVAGAPPAVDKAVALAEAAGARCRRLPGDYAFHSPLLAAAAEELGSDLPQPESGGEVPVYSTVTGAELDPRRMTDDHWVRNLRDRVEFERAVTAAARAGVTTFLEIGPHPALLRGIDDTLDRLDLPHRAVASLHRDRPGQRFEALAALYDDGAEIEWRHALPPPERPVVLPRYPWQHRRHWLAWLEDSAGPPPAAVEQRPALPDSRDERIEVVAGYLRERLAAALELSGPDEVPATGPVEDLGLDSLVIVELKNRAEADLGMRVPLAAVLSGGTPAEVAAAIVDALDESEDDGLAVTSLGASDTDVTAAGLDPRSGRAAAS